MFKKLHDLVFVNYLYVCLSFYFIVNKKTMNNEIIIIHRSLTFIIK